MLVVKEERKRRLFPQNCIGQLPRALHRLARQTVDSRYCVSYRGAMLMRSPLARDRRKPPGFIRPCQPVLSAKVPVGVGWIHELKHDGFRIVALKDGDDVRLWSRHGRNWSAEFVAITAAVMALPAARIVLDGEAVAHCPKGLPDFHALLGRSGAAKACLYAFDLLHVGDEDLRGRALVERRALLRKHLKRAGPVLVYSDDLAGADG